MKRPDTLIPLGYELGTGELVQIPARNLCITGQTQESGKTTALEALVSRSGLRAVAFVTKRHESGFANARRIAPYFRERADWEFVASVLEATLRERMKFQRSWIMKLCEYKAPTAGSGKKTGNPGWHVPRSLADVLANVEQALLTATGINESVYTELRAYLRMVVPQIERLPYSTALRLEPGLNVMNLVEYSTELQALVIRSVLEWIYEQETETVTVIPEAWEFIPQKRGSPVKLAAEALIRKGSAGRNYLWLDSQDLANVDKDIVRSCPVMILGVQREHNETKRTIAHIPATIQMKPKPRDIMTLGLGEFVVCFGKEIRRVYVQPAWLSDGEAYNIALGTRSVADIKRKPPSPSPAQQTNEGEEAVWREKYDALKRETDLQFSQLQSRLDELLNAQHATTLAEESAGPSLSELRREQTALVPPPSANGDAEAMYHYIVERIKREPPAALLRLLTERPELEIEVKREVLKVDGNSVKGRLGELIHSGFFDVQRSVRSAHEEIAEAGLVCTRPAVQQALDDLTLRRFLRKGIDAGRHTSYKAVAGMKVNVAER